MKEKTFFQDFPDFRNIQDPQDSQKMILNYNYIIRILILKIFIIHSQK